MLGVQYVKESLEDLARGHGEALPWTGLPKSPGTPTWGTQCHTSLHLGTKHLKLELWKGEF